MNHIILLTANSIFLPILIIGIIALILGISIAIVSKVFFVPVDEKVEALTEMLPGANCGACGYSGCSGYANALCSGSDSSTTKCSVGGPDTAAEIAEFMGVAGGAFEAKTAQVYCQGYPKYTKPRFSYVGTSSCKAANAVQNGPGSCTFGCLGFGDCDTVCEFDAIHVNDGVAEVNPDNCTACGACVVACPKSIIQLIPKNDNAYLTRCSNPLSGAFVRKMCDIGCIGCTKCVKTCPHKSITMEKSLAVIHQDTCQHCGECIGVCPTKAITNGLKIIPLQPIEILDEEAEKNAG